MEGNDNMLNKLSQIEKFIDLGANKEELSLYVKELNGLMQDMCGKPELYEHSSMTYLSGDVRLSAAKQSQENVAENPAFGLIPAVAAMEKKLRDFLMVYNIGSICEFKLVNSGIIDVDIRCGFLTKADTDSISVRKIRREQQLKTLDEYSIELSGSRKAGDLDIVASNKSIQNLKKLFADISAKFVRLKVVYGEEEDETDTIDRIHFLIHTRELLAMNIEPEPIVAEDSNLLNEDEKKELRKQIREIRNDAFTYLESVKDGNDRIKRLSYSLMLYRYTDMCDLLHISTSISDYVHDKSREEREKNLAANQIKDDIGFCMTVEQIRDGYNTLCDTLSARARDENKLIVCIPEVTSHEVSVKFMFSELVQMEYGWNFDYQTYFEHTFDTKGVFGEDMILCATERNMLLLDQFANHIGGRIECIDIGMSELGRKIGSVSIILDNVSKLFENAKPESMKGSKSLNILDSCQN